ncbi:hypothetical protein ACN38_g5041 [Penicillium nordicum]|uniref:Uncharacterized protein n=1 Tax=Penicillium nordicum TaxID=229535 RepID=A0A0M8P5R1_9EURO|nr:hypothetical protein ACN38_g5041 [Penicillium nordicum]
MAHFDNKRRNEGTAKYVIKCNGRKIKTKPKMIKCISIRHKTPCYADEGGGEAGNRKAKTLVKDNGCITRKCPR